MWQEWTNAVLGLAVIGVAFLGLTGSTLVWTLAVLGAAITIVAVWGVASLPESASRERHA